LGSDAQFSTFGTYQLAASRYELLCVLQGASGVADPALLGTFLDSPRPTEAQGGKRSGDNCSKPSSPRRRSPGVERHVQLLPSHCHERCRARRRFHPTSHLGKRQEQEEAIGPRWRNSYGRRRRQIGMPAPYVLVGHAHSTWTKIGASALLVRQLLYGLQLAWRRKL
jgi:hypothetical protein